MSQNSMNNTSLLKEYVKALVQNVDKQTLPKKIDLVFSGGGFNGFFAMGVAMYVLELRRQGHIKIARLSGCSIGSLVALLCLIDKDEDIDEWFTDIAACFRTNHNLAEYHDMVRKGVMRLLPTDDMSQINGHLFINFHDLKKKKKKVVSKYRNREHLIECILRSGHIPHIVDGNIKYKDRYSDGISPYIFDASPGVNILFVEIVTFNKLCHFIPHKTEINPQSRLLVGVADANEFFTRGSSDMCSYVEHWSTLRKAMFKCRDVLFMLVHAVIGLFVGLKAYIPAEVSDSIIYNGVANILKELGCEAMKRML
jgi:hypothetical protein